MKFEWEKISDKSESSMDWAATYRAKVFGGWLIRNFDLTQKYSNAISGAAGDFNVNLSTSESMVFMPDLNHEWTLE
jgi:hypothetical protein